MKRLLLLILLITPFYSIAQVDTAKYIQKEEFCVMHPEGLWKSYKISIDYGTKIKTFSQYAKDIAVTGPDGKDKKFESLIDIFNYMAQQGWVMVTSFTSGTGISNAYFVYKRPIAQIKNKQQR